MTEKKPALRQPRAKEVILNILENRVQKTIAYLSSERGRANWSLNIGRGFSEEQNYFAAIQTATRLIKYENIVEVMNELHKAIKAA